MATGVLFRKRQTTLGFTLIEAVTAVGLIAICVALVLPVLSKTRDDARIDQCAEHLRQLAAANLQYAEDSKGKFFYDWERSRTINGEEEGNWRGRWWDKERAGQYVEGIPLQWKPPIVAVKAPGQDEIERFDTGPFKNNAGLGGGTLACPSDEGAARSYHQNFWASGVSIDLPLAAQRDVQSWKQLPGEFFDTNSVAPHDRLILFGEMLSVYAAEQVAAQRTADWVTGGEFGSLHSPSARFAGAQFPFQRYDNQGRRWARESFPMQLDYVRHTGGDYRIHDNQLRVGGVNIGYADNHVAWRTHSDLYDTTSRQSLYQTLWSPVDEQVDSILGKELTHRVQRQD